MRKLEVAPFPESERAPPIPNHQIYETAYWEERPA